MSSERNFPEEEGIVPLSEFHSQNFSTNRNEDSKTQNSSDENTSTPSDIKYSSINLNGLKKETADNVTKNHVSKKDCLSENFDDSFDLFLPNKRTHKSRTDLKSKKRKSPYFDDCANNSTGSNSSLSQYERDLELAIALSLAENQKGNKTEKSGFLNEKKNSKPHEGRSKNGPLKKLCSVPLLLRRNQEEREKIITEKIGIVLVDNEGNPPPFSELDQTSNDLTEGKTARLWKLSQVNLSGIANDKFFVKTLIKYTNPVLESEDRPSQNHNSTGVHEEPIQSRENDVSSCEPGNEIVPSQNYESPDQTIKSDDFRISAKRIKLEQSDDGRCSGDFLKNLGLMNGEQHSSVLESSNMFEDTLGFDDQAKQLKNMKSALHNSISSNSCKVNIGVNDGQLKSESTVANIKQENILDEDSNETLPFEKDKSHLGEHFENDNSSGKTLEYPNSNHSFQKEVLNTLHDESTIDECEESGSNINLSRTEKWAKDVRMYKTKFELEMKSLRILSNDYTKLWNSSTKCSIITIVTKDKNLFIPCNILQARCLKLFEEIVDESLLFENYSSSLSELLFEYLVSGKIDLFDDINNEERISLIELCQKYEINFLKDYLSNTFDDNEFFSTIRSQIEKVTDSNKANECFDLEAKDAMDELNTSKQSRKFFMKEKVERPCYVIDDDNSSDVEILCVKEPEKKVKPKPIPRKIKSPECITIVSDSEDELFQTSEYIDSLIRKELEHSFYSPAFKTNFLQKTDSKTPEPAKPRYSNCSKSQRVHKYSKSMSGNVSESSDKEDKEDSSESSERGVEMNLGLDYVEAYHSPIYDNDSDLAPNIASTPVAANALVQNDYQDPPALLFQTPIPTTTLTEPNQHLPQNCTDLSEQFRRSEFLKLCSTPDNQRLRISDEVTPLPNFNTLMSPEIKKELSRYGMKQDISQDKAVKLLQYIYDQIHPNKHDPAVERILHMNAVPGPSGLCNVTPKKSERINYSSDSDISTDSYAEPLPEEIEESSEQCSLESLGSLRRRIFGLIKNNNELNDSIVSFKPLWLNQFHKKLKDLGVTCTVRELMTVLDDSCVMYRTEQSESQKEKRHKKSRSKTKKKAIKNIDDLI